MDAFFAQIQVTEVRNLDRGHVLWMRNVVQFSSGWHDRGDETRLKERLMHALSLGDFEQLLWSL